MRPSITLEKYEESFNTDLTQTTIGLVLGRVFHLGVDFRSHNINITLQVPKRIFFLTFWKTQKESFEYLQNNTDNLVFKI